MALHLHFPFHDVQVSYQKKKSFFIILFSSFFHSIKDSDIFTPKKYQISFIRIFCLIFPQHCVSGGGDLLHRDHLPSLPDRGRDQLCGQFNALLIFLFIFVFAFIFAFVFIFLLNLYLPPMIEVETNFVVSFVVVVIFFKICRLASPSKFLFPSSNQIFFRGQSVAQQQELIETSQTRFRYSKETISGGAMRMQEKGMI